MEECGRVHLALRRPALPRNGNVACGWGVVGAASEEHGPAKPQGPCSHFGQQAVGAKDLTVGRSVSRR